MHNLSILLITLVFIFPLLSFAESKTETKNRWKFDITRTQTDKNKIKKAARLLYTSPKEKEDSYSADMGLSGISSGMQLGDFIFNWVVSLEVHKNTLIDKEQDTRSLSVAMQGVLGNGISNWINTDYTIKYQDDRQKQKENLFLTADYTFGYRINSAPIPNVIKAGNCAWYALGCYSYTAIGKTIIEPTFSLQYHEIKSAPAGNVKGDRLRVKVNVEFEYTPKFNDDIVLGLTYTYWDTLNKDALLDSLHDTDTYREYALRYILGKSKKNVKIDKYEYGLAFSHVNGSNPEKGLDDQEYNQFGFEFNYNFK